MTRAETEQHVAHQLEQLLDDVGQPLARAVRQLLAAMTVIAEGQVGSLQPHVSSSKATGGDRPAGTARTLADEWAELLSKATDETMLRCLLEAGRAQLERHQGRGARPYTEAVETPSGEIVDPGEALGQVVVVLDSPADTDRILRAYQGLPAWQAARIESMHGHCTAAAIRALRARNDCDPATGLARPAREHRQAIAFRLAAAGKSERQIARELNVGQTTVRRLLGKDAAR